MARSYCRKCGRVWYSDEAKCPSCGSTEIRASGSSYGGSGIATN